MITDSLDALGITGLAREASLGNVTIALSADLLTSLSLESGVGADVVQRVKALQDIEAAEFDVLIIPDGLGNPQRQNYDTAALAIVRHFIREGKTIDIHC